MDVDSKHLVSFFAVCGADSLAPYDATGNDSSPLEQCYAPTVLCHFPKERRGLEFNPGAAVSLSLPSGARFVRASSVPPYPSFHSFVITDEYGVRTYGVSLLFYQRVDDKDTLEKFESVQNEYKTGRPEGVDLGPLWEPDEPLMQSKTLVLILNGPFITFGQCVLEQLLACGAADDGEQLTSQHIHCLLHSVFMPKPGSMVEYPGPFGSVYCRVAVEKDLPCTDYSFQLLMERFSVNDILIIFKCLLLESHILLISKDLHKLVSVAELLCTLLFPLFWEHVYAPIVPSAGAQQGDLYDAPCAFIMGAQIDCPSPSRDDIPMELSDEVCLVNIDYGQVDVQVHTDIPLPKAGLLMANLKEKLQKHNIDTPITHPLRSAGEERPTTTSGLSSVCGNTDLFRRDMQVCCDVDKPMPSVKVHNRHFLRKSSSATSSPPQHPTTSQDAPSRKVSSTPQSDKRARLARIAMEAGISTSFTPSASSNSNQALNNGCENMSPERKHVAKHKCAEIQHLQEKWAEVDESYMALQSFNRDMQGVFLDYFITLLQNYSLYIGETRNDCVDFDKMSFLSDQPSNLLSFFDVFLETVLFNKLLETKDNERRLEKLSPSLEYFEQRLEKATTRSDGHTSSHSASLRDKGRRRVTMTHSLRFEEFQQGRPGSSKPLNGGDLDMLPTHSEGSSPPADLNMQQQASSSGATNSVHFVITAPPSRELLMRARSASPDCGDTAATTSPTAPGPGFGVGYGFSKMNADHGRTVTSQATFVRRLLRECRHKIKRLLISNMGHDAVSLGHVANSSAPTEDHALITSLCDILERVWTHGNVQRKQTSRVQGKSFLWSHLQTYYEQRQHLLDEVLPIGDGDEHVQDSSASDLRTVDDLSLSPEISGRGMSRSSSLASVSELANNVKQFASNLRRERRSITKLREVCIMDTHVSDHIKVLHARYAGDHHLARSIGLLDDIRNVRAMDEIKTNIGYSRAFIRLCLEKKCLDSHVQELLEDRAMLESSYRDFAFLRCEEELEQFLTFLGLLTTSEISCFSTRYSQAILRYSIILLPGSNAPRQTTAEGTCKIFGSHSASKTVLLPPLSGSVSVETTNLGILDSAVVKCPGVNITTRYHRVFVISRMTDACYEMVLDCWPRTEDNNNELILVAKRVEPTTVLEANLCTRRPSAVASTSSGSSVSSSSIVSSPRRSVPSAGVASSATTVTIGITADFSEQPLDPAVSCLRDNVVFCVNHFAKYMDGGLPVSETLTALLWGDGGMCYHMQEAFAHGLKVSRVLRTKRPVWDFIERVCQVDVADAPESLCSAFTALDNRTQVCKSVKFFALICAGLRSSELPAWIRFLYKSSQCQKMYQPWALLCHGAVMEDILAVVRWLCDFKLVLPPSITLLLP